MLLLFTANLVAAENFKIDPKTSKAIPTFAGRVMLAKGQVLKLVKDSVSGDRIAKRLHVGSLVHEDDVIQVEKASVAKIRMTDDSLLTVGPSSQVKIQKFEFHTKSKRNVVFSLIQGRIRCYVLHKVRKNYKVKIESKIASLGVRGTEILANHVKGRDKRYHTEFALLSGNAVVTNKKSLAQQTLSTGERMWLFSQKKTVKRKLDVELFKQLTSADSYSDKLFPMLLRPLFIVSQNSISNHLRLGERVEQSTMKRFKQKSWKDNLKKLNELLNRGDY